jgi:hypothetical protein
VHKSGFLLSVFFRCGGSQWILVIIIIIIMLGFTTVSIRAGSKLGRIFVGSISISILRSFFLPSGFFLRLPSLVRVVPLSVVRGRSRVAILILILIASFFSSGTFHIMTALTFHPFRVALTFNPFRTMSRTATLTCSAFRVASCGAILALAFTAGVSASTSASVSASVPAFIPALVFGGGVTLFVSFFHLLLLLLEDFFLSSHGSWGDGLVNSQVIVVVANLFQCVHHVHDALRLQHSSFRCCCRHHHRKHHHHHHHHHHIIISIIIIIIIIIINIIIIIIIIIIITTIIIIIASSSSSSSSSSSHHHHRHDTSTPSWSSLWIN